MSLLGFFNNKNHKQFAMGQASDDLQLPYAGFTLADIQAVWEREQRFVPLEEAWPLHIKHQLENDFQLKEGDRRFDILHTLACTVDVRDELTGYHRSDWKDLNLELAKRYAQANYGHPPSVYALRDGGDEFLLLQFDRGQIAMISMDGKNFGALNPALSTDAEINAEKARQHKIEDKRENEPRRLNDRMGPPIPDDRRNRQIDALDYSPEGWQRADECIRFYAALAYSMAHDMPVSSIHENKDQVMELIHQIQTKFNLATGIEHLPGRKAGRESERGCGIAGTITVLSDETGRELPDEAKQEEAIKRNKDFIGLHSKHMLGETPSKRISNPETVPEKVQKFFEKYGLRLPVIPVERSITLSVGQTTQPDATPRSTKVAASTIIGELLAAGGDGNDFKQLTNNILNTTLGTQGKLARLINDVMMSSQHADRATSYKDHVVIFKIDNMPGMNEKFGHQGCNAILHEIMNRVEARVQESLYEKFQGRRFSSDMHISTGERGSDAGKFAIVLRGLTETEVQQTIRDAIGHTYDEYLYRHGFDGLTNPRGHRAGVHLTATTTPIRAGLKDAKEVKEFLGDLHSQLIVMKREADKDPNNAVCLTALVNGQWYQPDNARIPENHDTHDKSATLANHVKQLKAEYLKRDPVRQQIDFFQLLQKDDPLTGAAMPVRGSSFDGAKMAFVYNTFVEASKSI